MTSLCTVYSKHDALGILDALENPFSSVAGELKREGKLGERQSETLQVQ